MLSQKQNWGSTFLDHSVHLSSLSVCHGVVARKEKEKEVSKSPKSRLTTVFGGRSRPRKVRCTVASIVSHLCTIDQELTMTAG